MLLAAAALALVIAGAFTYSNRSRLRYAEDNSRLLRVKALEGKAIPASAIPRILHQTYKSRADVPAKVDANIAAFAPEYERRFYDDTDIAAFLAQHFTPEVGAAFRTLKSGAHKADLFRYCVLYIEGGVYMDIKTQLVRSLQDLFPEGHISTVIAVLPNAIYNGILAAPPRQSMFLTLIDGIVRAGSAPPYGLFVRELFRYIRNDAGEVRAGALVGQKHRFFLFRESCSMSAAQCEDGIDRYGLCCNIMRGDERVIKTRYADFPWGQHDPPSVQRAAKRAMKKMVDFLTQH